MTIHTNNPCVGRTLYNGSRIIISILHSLDAEDIPSLNLCICISSSLWHIEWTVKTGKGSWIDGSSVRIGHHHMIPPAFPTNHMYIPFYRIEHVVANFDVTVVEADPIHAAFFECFIFNLLDTLGEVD